ncbi:hypothetical protein [Polyangium aurulentum]|nr:hypothetical protein [Polyangium aurulentum]
MKGNPGPLHLFASFTFGHAIRCGSLSRAALEAETFAELSAA